MLIGSKRSLPPPFPMDSAVFPWRLAWKRFPLPDRGEQECVVGWGGSVPSGDAEGGFALEHSEPSRHQNIRLLLHDITLWK